MEGNYANVREENLGVLVLIAVDRDSQRADTQDGVYIGQSDQADSSSQHGVVIPLPSVCRLQEFTPAHGEPRMMMRVRVNFGDLLNVFESLVRRLDLKELESFYLRLLIVADRVAS
jgi:hypothetical protein